MSSEKDLIIDFIEWLAYKKDIHLVDNESFCITPYVDDYYDFTRLGWLIAEYQKDINV